MPLIARASNTVRNKNLIIVAMCLVFCGLFLRDGYYAYPHNNDVTVQSVYGKGQMDPAAVSPETMDLAKQWLEQRGWNNVSDDMHQKMDAALHSDKEHISTEGWKSPFDVRLQRGFAWGLVGCVAAAVYWLVRCQRRRAMADAATISPAPGVVIPWDKITKVDNSRWKSVGIVDITYTDAQGASRKADFDDYKLQREPLLEILDLLAEKAVNAEFLPKVEAAPAADSNPAPTSGPSEDPSSPP